MDSDDWNADGGDEIKQNTDKQTNDTVAEQEVTDDGEQTTNARDDEVTNDSPQGNAEDISDVTGNNSCKHDSTVAGINEENGDGTYVTCKISSNVNTGTNDDISVGYQAGDVMDEVSTENRSSDRAHVINDGNIQRATDPRHNVTDDNIVQRVGEGRDEARHTSDGNNDVNIVDAISEENADGMVSPTSEADYVTPLGLTEGSDVASGLPPVIVIAKCEDFVLSKLGVASSRNADEDPNTRDEYDATGNTTLPDETACELNNDVREVPRTVAIGLTLAELKITDRIINDVISEQIADGGSTGDLVADGVHSGHDVVENGAEKENAENSSGTDRTAIEDDAMTSSYQSRGSTSTSEVAKGIIDEDNDDVQNDKNAQVASVVNGANKMCEVTSCAHTVDDVIVDADENAVDKNSSNGSVGNDVGLHTKKNADKGNPSMEINVEIENASKIPRRRVATHVADTSPLSTSSRKSCARSALTASGRNRSLGDTICFRHTLQSLLVIWICFVIYIVSKFVFPHALMWNGSLL